MQFDASHELTNDERIPARYYKHHPTGDIYLPRVFWEDANTVMLLDYLVEEGYLSVTIQINISTLPEIFSAGFSRHASTKILPLSLHAVAI